MMERKGDSMENESNVTEGNKIFCVYEPLICKQCNKSFEKKTCFRSHLKSHKFDDHTYEAKKRPPLDKHRPHMCNICEKKFTAKKNLLKHLRVIHKNLNEAEKLQVKKTRCPEVNCLFACRKMRDLRNHIEKYHEIKILKDTLQFSSEADFLKWKKEEEDNSVASFVSFRKKFVLRNGTIKKVLLCHRTGQYNPKGTGKHRLKSHGSCKIGGKCPAAMEIVQFPDGQVTVFYYKTHLGHSQDVVHLQLSREDRAKLSERIKQGFSLDAILEDVKESIDPETGKTKRIHLLSRKDLYNIIQSSNSKKTKNESNTGILLNNGVNQDQSDRVKEIENGCESTVGETVPKTEAAKEDNTCINLNHSNETDFSTFQVVNVNAALSEAERSPTVNAECGGAVNKTSQLLIVSPNVSYRSVAELILFQPSENPPNQSTKLANPASIPEAKLVLTEKKPPEPEKNQEKPEEVGKREKITQTNAKNQTSNSPLMLKLQEKLEMISNLLPKSEYLTPRQYEGISRKLDSIIGVYSSVNVKGKSKKLTLKKLTAKKVSEEKSQASVECVIATPQNVIQPQVYETPLYAYLCNYN